MQVSLNEPAMEQAWGVIKELSADEQERLEAEAAEKARLDFVARIRYAEMKGRQEGLNEGKQKERLGIVSYMFNHGHSPDEISAAIGLTLDEVVELIAMAKDNK